MSTDAAVPAGRDRILAAARAVFAEQGFHGARLQDVAERAGVRHPTLLYHFGSKEGLYMAVLEEALADWARATGSAIRTGLRGFDQVAALVEAGMWFFVEHEDFVRIARHELLAGGGRLEDAMVSFIRPFLEDGVRFLEREVAAGQLREHDPVELIHLCYGTLLTYVSDARFRRKLTGEDPLDREAVSRHLQALLDLLRAALDPPPAGARARRSASPIAADGG